MTLFATLSATAAFTSRTLPRFAAKVRSFDELATFTLFKNQIQHHIIGGKLHV
jgi:hypothetical protein